MENFESILRYDEKAVLSLRRLYSSFGYSKFKMSKFEEYDLYSKNKDFLVSDGVITFNDTNGKLLALKPDVTLSIIKNASDSKEIAEKFYYNENVYRIAEDSHAYKEIMQTGVECIGKVGFSEVLEVSLLAAKSLEKISSEFMLHFSDIGFIDALFEDYKIENREEIITYIAEKNAGSLKSVLSKDQFAALKCLVKNYKDYNECLLECEKICKSDAAKKSLNELCSIVSALEKEGYSENIKIDFSIISAKGYYSGIVFKGYIGSISSRVLSGGQYDKLMKKMNKTASAIGFAVYLDTLERLDDKKTQKDNVINIALPKGRLGEKVYAMFEASGFECPSIKEQTRKLIFENEEKQLRFFWVKPSDVAIYVERGAADIGVAGKDILLEYEPDVFELLDLKVGKCKMAVAAKKDFKDDKEKTLRVATKFSNIASKFYKEKCRDIDIIHLNGSIEIAPILELSDVIVDIVETGKTLFENNLDLFETIVPISARLIANKGSYSFKSEKIEAIKSGLLSEVMKNND